MDKKPATRPAHARLSPSAISRWQACSASIALEDAVRPPHTTTEFAEFGTRTHRHLEYRLKHGRWPHDAPSAELDVAVEALRLLHEVAPEIDQQGYGLHSERLVDVRLGGMETFGTADVIAVSPGRQHLIVADLKTGYTPVHAVENPQLACYLLGAHQSLFDQHSNGMVLTGIILQPRVNTADGAVVSRWNASMNELLAVLEQARVSAEAMMRGEYRYAVSESTCRWCKVRAQCPALAEYITEAVADSGATAGMVPDMTPVPEAKLQHMMRACRLAPALAEAVRERVIDADANGRKVAGLEVVPGRAGPRKWVSVAQVESRLRREAGDAYGRGMFHELKLMSPTALEKADAQAYSAASDFVSRSEGVLNVRLEDEAEHKLLVRGKREAEKQRLASKMAEDSSPYDRI